MVLKATKLISNFLIFGLLVLIFTDLIYPSKGDDVNRLVPQVGRALMFAFIFVAIIFVSIKHRYLPKSPVLNVSLLFFIYTIFAYILHFEYLGANFMSLIKTLYWVIGFIFVYMLSSKGFINEKQVELFVTVSITVFFLIILRDITNVALFRGSKNYFVSNNGYNLLRFFPYVFLLNRNSLKYFLTIIVAIGVFLSLKRGTILAFTVSTMIAFILLLFSKHKNIKINKLALILVGISVSILLGYIISENSENLLHRLKDFQNVETAGSGRGKMYTLIIKQMLTEGKVTQLIFGNGFLSTIPFFDRTIGHPIVAHSDILELFFDYGIVGIIIFFFFFKTVFKVRAAIKPYSYKEWLAITIWIIQIFMSSIYSVNFFSPEMIYSVFMIAYIEGKRKHLLASQ